MSLNSEDGEKSTFPRQACACMYVHSKETCYAYVVATNEHEEVLLGSAFLEIALAGSIGSESTLQLLHRRTHLVSDLDTGPAGLEAMK